jgi:hypothetical protein
MYENIGFTQTYVLYMETAFAMDNLNILILVLAGKVRRAGM